MDRIPNNSIDLIVTDPDYGYDFMGKGKEWGGLPRVELWEKAKDKLKDGAIIFVFSANRQDVHSEMINRLNAAGFIIKFPSVYWAYACISEDTEILTRDGFKGIDELTKDDIIASLNIKSEEIEYVNVLDKFIYQINDELINIKTKNTDQLVTKNHRILLKIKSNSRYNYSGYEYKYAIDLLNRRKRPFYQLPLAKKFIGSKSIGKYFAELLGWIITDGNYYQQKTTKYNDIRIYQTSSNQEKVNRIEYLLNKLQIHYSDYNRERKYKDKIYIDHCFCIKDKDWKRKIRKYLPNKKPIKDLLFLVPEELEYLFKGLIGGDGSIIKGSKYSYVFWQKDKSNRDFMQILALHLGFRTSINKKKYCINIGWRSSTEIQNIDKHIQLVNYKGKVWSITTKNGNYVARRNGYVFITGNSGLPKALNISKAIDKRLGVEQEAVGEYISPYGREYAKEESFQNGFKNITGLAMGREKGKERLLRTTPVSPQAKALDGAYAGYNPKPAVEIVIVGMKPLSEKTYIEQALKNQKGITWLDDCRIPTDPEIDDMLRTTTRQPRQIQSDWTNKSGFKAEENKYTGVREEGRYASHLLVSDNILDDGEKRSQGHWSKSKITGYGTFGNGTTKYTGVGEKSKVTSFSHYFSLDRWYEYKILRNLHKLPKSVQKTFPFMLVPKAYKSEKWFWCKICDIAEHNSKEKHHISHYRYCSDCNCNYGLKQRNKHEGHKTKTNIIYHITQKPRKIIAYLITLGSRPGDIILDPFMGSGTTPEQSYTLGRNYIGFDKDPISFKIASARMSPTKTQRKIESFFRK